VNAREDQQAERVGSDEFVDRMSTIEFRRWCVELLAIDPWRLPHGFEQVARLLAIELDRERTRRVGAPWHDLVTGPRRDAASRLPRGVPHLPD
jgi:hypothetical protein